MKAPSRSKDHLVSVALTLFADLGYGAVSEDKLLAEAKVARGILMYHFNNKAGVMQEIIRSYTPHFEHILSTHPQDPIQWEDLSQIVDNWVAFLTSHTTFWKCYFPLTLYPQFHSLAYPSVIHDFHTIHGQNLTTYYRHKGHTTPSSAYTSFETFRRGIWSGYLADEHNYPLKQMTATWKALFS